MRFVKMHGIGNDYVYVDAVSEPGIGRRSTEELASLARRISDRHTGVGSDGLILLCPPTESTAHVRMRMWNSDGSESEMCGNGVRCVAKFAHDRLGITAKPMQVQTGRGVLAIDSVVRGGKLVEATVDMGEPILELARIPVDAEAVRKCASGYAIGEHAARVRPRTFEGIEDWQFVSMGNPHAVSWELSDNGANLRASARMAPICSGIERSPAFPNRINVHMARDRSRQEADMVTWERGAGFTQACGTGACAVCVAGVLNGRLERDVLLHLPGGDLRVRWDERTNHVFMTGPAAEVFEGEWPD